MLKFFRRYQRIFFVFVTVMIVISFSFFGSYSMLGNMGQVEDAVAFTAIDGTPVKQSELHRMMVFLSSDYDDAMRFDSSMGANFLNDGVIRKDILSTGLGSLIGGHYLNLISDDLEIREGRERHFQPYRHPYAKFLGAEAAWSFFAPHVKSSLDGLLDAGSLTASKFNHRAQLYLAEQQFPQEALKQTIRLHEQQMTGASRDPHLEQRDLSLFGYHTLEDWFGQRFLALVSQVIINGSILAEERGYVVSDEETWVDLRRRAEIAFAQMATQATAPDGKALLEGQLQRMRIDKRSAVALWKRVMLFRRLFQESGSLALVDTFAFDRLARFCGEVAEIAVYQLPEGFRLKNFSELVELECYLDAVSERREVFALPTHLRTKEAIWQTNPELIQKRFLIHVGEVEHSHVARRITVRDLLDWELVAANFARLAEEFPGLLQFTPQNRAERHEALTRLDRETRPKLDALAKCMIVDEHPDWIAEDLENAPRRTVTLAITEWGGTFPLAGIKSRRDLRRALEENDHLAAYTQDGRRTYCIDVIDRDAEESVLTFAEARKTGVLADLVERRLSSYYEFLRDESPFNYAHLDGTAKSLEEVRRQVAGKMLAPLIATVHSDALAAGQLSVPDAPNGEFATFNRFAHYLRSVRDTLYLTDQDSDWITTRVPHTDPEKLAPRAPLAEQWKIIRETSTITRHHHELPGCKMAFDLKEGGWSSLMTQGSQGTYFFRVLRRNSGTAAIAPEKVVSSQEILSFEAQRCMGQYLLRQMDRRGDISLAQDLAREAVE